MVIESRRALSTFIIYGLFTHCNTISVGTKNNEATSGQLFGYTSNNTFFNSAAMRDYNSGKFVCVICSNRIIQIGI